MGDDVKRYIMRLCKVFYKISNFSYRVSIDIVYGLVEE